MFRIKTEPQSPEPGADLPRNLTAFATWVFEHNPANYYETPEEMLEEWHLGEDTG